MRKLSTRKSSAADLLSTPTSLVATPNHSPNESPKIFKFSSSCSKTRTSSSSSLNEDSRIPNNHNSKKPAAAPPTATSPALSSLSNARSRIADLKEMTSSRIDSIKRQIDCSYSNILKETELSHSRLHKRHKVLNQACEETMHEAEKDFKKIIDHMSETHDAMEASYMDMIAEAQARGTRLCKTSIPELSQSVDRAIDVLRSHYGSLSTSP